MPKVQLKASFNPSAAATMIRAASNAGLTATGMQALQDTNIYVPRDQGTLESSSYTHSDRTAENGEFHLRWDTPYARYLWNGDVMYGNPTNRTYGPEKLTFTAALAREEWAKYAAEVYKEDWRKVYVAAMKRRLKK